MFSAWLQERRGPLLVFLAALCGFFAWGHGLTPLAALSVLLWGLASTRGQAWGVMFGYYLGGSRTLPFSSEVFFGDEAGLALGVVLWLASAAVLALPWAAVARTHRIGLRLAGLAFALVAVSLPPIGVIGWMNPWLGASLALPGMGWASLAVGLIFLSLLSLVDLHPRPRQAIAAALAVCALASIHTATTSPPPSPAAWAGVDFRAGRAPETADEQGDRQRQLVRAVDQAVAGGNRVIILPEQFLGNWSKSWRLFIEDTLGDALLSANATLIVGAAMQADERGATENAAFVYDGRTWRQASARFAMPVSMWKPWAEDSTVVQWVGDGVYKLDGRRFMLSLCFEDVTMWLPILSFASSPEVIVSMANAWWASGSRNIVAIQREHIEAWARIFDVPLVRAVNTP